MQVCCVHQKKLRLPKCWVFIRAVFWPPQLRWSRIVWHFTCRIWPPRFTWTRGKEDPSLRFIQDDNRDLTAARLALLRATAIVLANGLDVIGVEPETEMR